MDVFLTILVDGTIYGAWLFLIAIGLTLVFGVMKILNVAHGALYAIGAYAAALLVERAGIGMEAALILAPVAAAIGAAIIGWFAVRLSGVYLAMLTLAAAQILWSASVQWQDVTGGDDGILGIWPAAWASGTTAYYYLTLALTTVGIVSLMMLASGRFGILLRAGRDAPARAQALGSGNCLQSCNTDTYYKELGRRNSSRRRHHHRQDLIKPLGGINNRCITGDIGLGTERIHFLRQG